MIEWGVVQSNDRKAVMIIEEGAGGSVFKLALNRVWVQMAGLPEELSDYPTIWAIGTILRVKEVDMKFTRSMDGLRFQVTVHDPDLIPHYVDVVISDFNYELHFKVEPEGMRESAVLLKMDDKDDIGEEGASKEDLHEVSNMQIDNTGTGQRDGGSSSKLNQQSGNSESQGTKRVLFQLMALEAADPRLKAPATLTELEPDDGGVEHPDVACVSDPIAMHKEEFSGLAAHDRVKLLATIPEASPPSRRSKGWADNANHANRKGAEKMKAARNLDASCDQGTTDSTINSLLHFIKEDVINNLESIGINRGNGESEVCNEVDRIKSQENDRCVEQFTKDEVSRIFDQEENELAEETS
jgi:hypothetical protein